MYGVKLWRKLVGLIRSGATSAEESALASSPTETEFTAEIVRVTRVLPHPNADRLEILRFEMKGIGETAYEVVSQKGQFQVGDLAAYFSVDCLLPTGHPDFRFLLERLDGKGKEIYRLRAARLRGVFSQGLLVPVPTKDGRRPSASTGNKIPGVSEFGNQVAEHFGVTYYRRPEPGEPTQPGTKKPQKQPFPIYGVDSLKKLPRLFEEGERVVVTEKIHGTNFRFGWVPRKFLGFRVGWKFVVGSHRVIKGNDGNHYYGEDLWSDTATRLCLADVTKQYKGYAFYGELFGHTWSGGKIQDLTYGKNSTALCIFDIRDEKGQWMDPWTRRNLCAELDLEHVPILSQGPELTTMEFSAKKIEALSNGPSLIAPHQIREGVVVESVDGPRRKAKYVGESYLMRKEAA